MVKKKLINLTLLLLTISLLACTSGDFLAALSSPTPTPTFVLARFTTATATTISTDDSPVAESTQTVTATRAATATPTASPTPPKDVSATETPATDENSNQQTTPEAPTATPTPQATSTATTPPSPPTATPTETPLPTPAPLAGRIAFPIDDGGGYYDVWVVELPDGDPFMLQKRAHQPSFSNDGRLLVKLRASEFGDHIGLLDANYAWQGLVSDSPYDGFPFWHPDGSRYVFSNPQLLRDPLTGDWLPHVFIPCSMRRPSFEEDIYCRDIHTGGKVVIGEFPVWTDDDRIAYFNFTTADDGIYVVSAASALWDAGGVGPPQLLVKSNGRPSDTQGFQVFFSAGTIDQNWEAYMIDLDGTNLVNLSNSPYSQDGLPTVSPNGNWVAFVSDRDGLWGIWVVPRTGGEPTKLVDFSKINTNPSPWGTGDRDWTFERISWGP